MTELALQPLAEARSSLARHGRSFRFAGALLAPAELDDAAVIYAFCRRADDAVDEAANVAGARAAVADLDRVLRDGDKSDPLVGAFLDVCARRGSDVRYARELLVGMASDAHDAVVIEDDAALLRYCYRAAGVVGGLMAPLLGAKDPAALPHAVDLGIAMQLTNICRDVLEDARRGRLYLPARRLRDAGGRGDVGSILDGADRDAVVRVVRDLLALADRYYESGARGFPALTWRGRLAIAVASRVYRAIGVKLLRRGGDPLLGRVTTTFLEKLACAVAALPAAFLARTSPHETDLHACLRGLPGTAGRHEPVISGASA